MINKIELNNCSDNDLEFVLSVLHAAAKRLEAKNIDQWKYWLNPPQEKIEWLQSGLNAGEFFTIRSETEIVGIVRLMESDELYWGIQEIPAYYIHSLIVLDKFVGHEIGKKTMKYIEELSGQKDKQCLRLDCVSENKGLVKYYENLGFKKVGEKQMPLSHNVLLEKEIL